MYFGYSVRDMKRPENTITITQTHINTLLAAKERTGCGAARFLRWSENTPQGLNSQTIYHWMNGIVVHANKEYLEFVLDQWPKMPIRVSLDDAMVKKLCSEMTRTGLGPSRLIKTMPNAPDGLNLQLINRMMNGNIKLVREDHLQAVLDAYAAI